MEKYVRYGLRDTVDDYFDGFINETFESWAYTIYEVARDLDLFKDLRLPLQMFEDSTELLGFQMLHLLPWAQGCRPPYKNRMQPNSQPVGWSTGQRWG